VAAVALGDQHLEQLAPARHQGAEVAGGLVRQGPHRRPDRLGEAGDRRRVQPVGLRQPARGAGEGPHPARVDDRDRQAGRGQGRREADLQPPVASSTTSAGASATRRSTSAATLLVVVVEGEALAGGARVDVEAVLGDVDADEDGVVALSMTRFRWMRACRPW
jgi:hypothetical protein